MSLEIMSQKTAHSNSPILNSGGPPPVRQLPWIHFDQELMLLYAAWAHGLKANDEVHRYTLFSYIQTHIDGKMEQQLQGTIQRSTCWKKREDRDGFWQLTQRGERALARFGELPAPANLFAGYWFSKSLEGVTFTVRVNVVGQRYEVSVNGRDVSGVEACKRLALMTGLSITENQQRPAFVLNWIVGEGPFSWRRDG